MGGEQSERHTNKSHSTLCRTPRVAQPAFSRAPNTMSIGFWVVGGLRVPCVSQLHPNVENFESQNDNGVDEHLGGSKGYQSTPLSAPPLAPTAPLAGFGGDVGPHPGTGRLPASKSQGLHVRRVTEELIPGAGALTRLAIHCVPLVPVAFVFLLFGVVFLLRCSTLLTDSLNPSGFGCS